MSKLYDNVKKQGEQIDDLQSNQPRHPNRDSGNSGYGDTSVSAAGKSEADNRETAG